MEPSPVILPFYLLDCFPNQLNISWQHAKMEFSSHLTFAFCIDNKYIASKQD